MAVRASVFAPLGVLCSPDCAEALRWYQWEASVASAFFTLLRHLERALGHAMSDQLTKCFEREDWWDHPGVNLHHVSRRKIGAAIEKQARRRGQTKAETVQRELTLGFWVSLLGRGNDYETRLWRPALRHAFPAYHGARQPLHQDLDHLRTLRNRVAHHEPVGTRDLDADRRSALRVMGYLSHDLRRWAVSEDGIPSVLAERPAPCPSVSLPAQREED